MYWPHIVCIYIAAKVIPTVLVSFELNSLSNIEVINMAVSKKKAKTKKKAGSKSTAKSAASGKKSVASKSTAKQKKSAPKKAVKRKAGIVGTKAKKFTSTRTVKTDSDPVKKAQPAKQKLSSVKSKKIGSRIKTLTGRAIGERGIIVRQDACLGTFFILLDRYSENPVYKNIEWGPYFESQLEFLKSR